jgi:hypothetical protein
MVRGKSGSSGNPSKGVTGVEACAAGGLDRWASSTDVLLEHAERTITAIPALPSAAALLNIIFVSFRLTVRHSKNVRLPRT